MRPIESNNTESTGSDDNPPTPPLPAPPTLPPLPALPPFDEVLMTAATAIISNGVPSSTTTSASSISAQQQHKQRQQPNATSTPATPATPATATATAAATTTSTNPAEIIILRIIAKMLRQHADLYSKQASYLEKMAFFTNISDTNNNNDAPGNNPRNNNCIDINGDNQPLSTMWDHTIPSREELQDKIRRDSVVDLAKKSYEGMKGVQSIVDAVLIKKKVQGAHGIRGESRRRRFAFELFEQDILHSIEKEAKFKELAKAQNELKKKKKRKKSKESRTDHDNNYKSLDNNGDDENDPLAAYIFQRTQEEWKKLNKKKIAMYAKKAEGEDGIKHIELIKKIKKTKNAKIKKRTASTINKKECDNETEPIFKKLKIDPNTNSHTDNNSKEHYERRKMTPSSDRESRKILDDDDSTDDDNNSDSNTKPSLGQNNNNKNDDIGSDNSSINRTKQEEGDDKSDSDEEDPGFDLLAMPPMPQTTPIKRERDESSSSGEDGRETTRPIKRERDEFSSSEDEEDSISEASL